MIFLKWLKNFILYPVEWFWNKYKDYKEENCIWKIIVLFLISVSGFGVFIFLTFLVIDWILVNHIEVVVFFLAILWLYSYVHSKMEAQERERMQQQLEQQALLQNQQDEEKRLQEEQANKSYPIMRTIMYQTLKSSADSIGGLVPRILEEIEIDGKPYVITNNIIFYQFRLSKANINSRYNTDELQEFARILQNDIANKIRSGAFPSLAIQNHVNEFGDIHEAIYIDIIEDIDNYFIIQPVFYSPAYATYLRNKKMYQTNTDNTLKDEKW